jgi:hypothetical protein
MIVAALINSDYKLNSLLTFFTLRDNPKPRPEINEFVRGVLWNDDPECPLFDDNTDANLVYSTDLLLGGPTSCIALPNLIHRSHFGHLQWLHSMGSEDKEPAEITKKDVLRWMEIMYSLAIGAMAPTTLIKDTWLRDGVEDVKHYISIGDLLTFRHKSSVNIQNRALSSCFHVIQDS